MQDEQYRRRKVAQIEEDLKMLLAPVTDPRHKMMSELDRLHVLKTVMAHIAIQDYYTQAELSVYWLNSVANKHRELDMATKLFNNLSRVLYAGPKLEKWAESRLINTDMKITPMAMAREYAIMTKGDERMAGLFVRDMQRIKSRLLNRIARTGSPERKKGYEVMVQRPRHKRTLRQSNKYNKLMEERKARKLI